MCVKRLIFVWYLEVGKGVSGKGKKGVAVHHWLFLGHQTEGWGWNLNLDSKQISFSSLQLFSREAVRYKTGNGKKPKEQAGRRALVYLFGGILN